MFISTMQARLSHRRKELLGMCEVSKSSALYPYNHSRLKVNLYCISKGFKPVNMDERKEIHLLLCHVLLCVEVRAVRLF